MSDYGHSRYSMIHQCLSAIAAAPPSARAPAHSELAALLPSLPSPLALDAPDDAPPQTAGQALNIAAAAQLLLPQLESGEASSPIPGETAGRIRRALEQLSAQLGAAIRRERAAQVRGLYVIIDPQVTGGREPLDIAIAAVNGGARMLQLRDKLRDKGESLPLAIALQELCQRHGAMLIINDHADVATAAGSAGLHVGQTDLPVAQARRILQPDQVIGRSNREFEQLVESQAMGADHVAFGAIYATTSKGVARNPQGPQRLRQARELATAPLVAIGGINLSNVAPVVEAGADAVCVTAAVGLAAEPEAAAAAMTAAIAAAGGRV